MGEGQIVEQFDSAIAFITMMVGVAALVIALRALKVSGDIARAALYDHRSQVYSDTQEFVGAWIQAGKPDMSKLPLIARAWGRSQFLFKKPVTDHIRGIWTDATRAQYLIDIQDNPPENFEGNAITERNELLQSHADLEKLIAIFSVDMAV